MLSKWKSEEFLKVRFNWLNLILIFLTWNNFNIVDLRKLLNIKLLTLGHQMILIHINFAILVAEPPSSCRSYVFALAYSLASWLVNLNACLPLSQSVSQSVCLSVCLAAIVSFCLSLSLCLFVTSFSKKKTRLIKVLWLFMQLRERKVTDKSESDWKVTRPDFFESSYLPDFKREWTKVIQK